ncbi:MAG: tyrosine-type recombinase/integrase [Acidobacteriota bacterium]|nr:tyrosine-type recombinase/integrase [Acidobacteriota bacterium]
MARTSKVRVIKLPDGRYGYDLWFKQKRYRKITGLNRSETIKAGYKKLRDLEQMSLGIIDVDADQAPVLFEVFAEDFIKKHSRLNKRPASVGSDLNSLKHLKRYFKNKYLHAIDPELVEDYKAQRRSCVSAASVNREIALLKTIMAKAVEWKRIAVNPIAGKAVRKFMEPEQEMRILTPDEARRLIEAATGHLKPFLIIALNTGMRRNEILTLRWDNLDFTKGEIIVRPEISKSKRRRLVPMNNEVAEALRTIEKNSPFLFYNPETKSNIKDIKQPFSTAKRLAKIRGHLRVHDLRHTAASWMVEAGADIMTVKEVLGHASVVTTMRYCHPTRESKRRAVDILSNRLKTDILVDSRQTSEAVRQPVSESYHYN